MREFLAKLEKKGLVTRIKKKLSTKHQIPAVIKQNPDKVLVFEKPAESKIPVVAGVCSNRTVLAESFGCKPEQLVFKLAKAMENPTEPKVVSKAPCQEVVEKQVDLHKLPILTHGELDPAPYVTVGLSVVKNKTHGRNSSYHRLMLLGKDKFAARICNRHTQAYLDEAGGELDIAISIGNHPAPLLASAIHGKIDMDEFSVANALSTTRLVKCKTIDVEVPADSEIVLEGKITTETAKEGPFVDMTGTYDIVRDQPVIKIHAVTHRKNPYYQALLSGGPEHRILMGMPREPTMYSEVNKVCDCVNVALSPGGCSWLHGVVQIRKKSDDEPKKAVQAAFKGHSSMKHVVIVDEDINILDPEDIEWAIATRVQADKDAVIFKAKGSSLDPSSDFSTGETAKVGLDATIPLGRGKKDFLKAKIPGQEKPVKIP